jgi:transposase
MNHKAGDKMFVDYTGQKLSIVDTYTGEIKAVEVFVAILGGSQYTYVEAVESQRVEDFISCCENALHFFEGSPNVIVPDKLKSAVVKTNRYEPKLNENFEAYAILDRIIHDAHRIEMKGESMRKKNSNTTDKNE